MNAAGSMINDYLILRNTLRFTPFASSITLTINQGKLIANETIRIYEIPNTIYVLRLRINSQ